MAEAKHLMNRHERRAAEAEERVGADGTAAAATELDQGILLVTAEEAGRMLRIGRTSIYELLRRGLIRSIAIGRNRRIPVSEVRRIASEGIAAEEAAR